MHSDSTAKFCAASLCWLRTPWSNEASCAGFPATFLHYGCWSFVTAQRCKSAITGAWEDTHEDPGSNWNLVPHFHRLHTADRIFPEQGFRSAQGSSHKSCLQAPQFPPSVRRRGAKALAPGPRRQQKNKKYSTQLGCYGPFNSRQIGPRRSLPGTGPCAVKSI